MNIDSAQLRTFVAVLREGSFDAAARVLNVTAPAVSQRIKQLEERLGQVLIRRGSPCQATDAGMILSRYAEQLTMLEAETLHALGDSASLARSYIRLPIAVNADSIDSWFMEVFEALPDEAQLYLDVRTDDQDHSIGMLRDGAVIAAVTAEPQAVQGCNVLLLGAMRYLAVASPAYMARYFPEGLTAQALAQAPMLQFNTKDALQARFLHVLGHTPASIQAPTHFLPSTTAFLDAARRGIAWGMIPESMAQRYLDNGELVEVSAGVTLDVPLYWQYWALSSNVLTTLSRAVQTVAKRLLRQS